MLLDNHFQNAYITRDLEQAMALFKTTHDFDRFVSMEVRQQLKTRSGNGEAVVKMALGWIGDLQYELIQPVSGLIDVYLDGLPERHPMQFHHVCMRVIDDWDGFRARLEREKQPIVMEGSGMGGGLKFLYLDARATLGHYLEYCWMTPERWTQIRQLGVSK
jgi:hypothetical protein